MPLLLIEAGGGGPPLAAPASLLCDASSVIAAFCCAERPPGCVIVGSGGGPMRLPAGGDDAGAWRDLLRLLQRPPGDDAEGLSWAGVEGVLRLAHKYDVPAAAHACAAFVAPRLSAAAGDPGFVLRWLSLADELPGGPGSGTGRLRAAASAFAAAHVTAIGDLAAQAARWLRLETACELLGAAAAAAAASGAELARVRGTLEAEGLAIDDGCGGGGGGGPGVVRATRLDCWRRAPDQRGPTAGGGAIGIDIFGIGC